MAQRLFESGDKLNEQSKVDGMTPLVRALLDGQPEVAWILVANEADVNRAAADGTTPLVVAATRGAVYVVQALLQRGARVSATSVVYGDEGQMHEVPGSELIVAVNAGHLEVVRMLLAHGAECPRRLTERLVQDAGVDVEIARILLDHSRHPSPLHLAVQHDRLKLVVVLLQHGASLSQRYAYGTGSLRPTRGGAGQTPLEVAAKHGTLAMVQLLAEFGAVTIDTKEGVIQKAQQALARAQAQVHTHRAHFPHNHQALAHAHAHAHHAHAAQLQAHGGEQDAHFHALELELEHDLALALAHAHEDAHDAQDAQAQAHLHVAEIHAHAHAHGDGNGDGNGQEQGDARRQAQAREEVQRRAGVVAWLTAIEAWTPLQIAKWDFSRHRTYNLDARAAVHTLLLASSRITVGFIAAADAVVGDAVVGGAQLLSHMPKEMWLLIASFLHRSDWPM
jgi:ankyrin repeat protein